MKVKYFILSLGFSFVLCSTSQSNSPDPIAKSQTIYFPGVEKIDHDFEKKPYENLLEYQFDCIEAYSHHDVEFIPSYHHSFIEALVLGFNYHKPIIISPDHIWLLVCQGFANHVNHSPEELRHFFVNFEGKNELTVRRDDFVKGKENPWEKIFPEFAKQIKEQVGDPVDILVADFSTTDIIEKTAFQITLMSTFKVYFDCILRTLCGFPSITIEGTPEDWQDILQRAKLLREYDLEWWIDELEPILK